MTRRSAVLHVVAAMLLWVPLSAHEGHDHKVMGTVVAIQDTHLEVKGTDSKTTAFVLNEKTKILRGTAVAKSTDITPGVRVVVTAEQTKDKAGQVIMMAKEVRLGESPQSAARK